MNNDQIFCSQCGTASSADKRFCSKCGAPLAKEEPETPKCQNCGAEVDPTSAFCTNCGANLQAVAPETVECEAIRTTVAEAPAKRESSRTPRGIIKRSLALLVSILLMAFAFLPVYSFEIDNYALDDYGIEPSLSISIIESITLSIDAMHELDEEEIVDSNLYYKGEELDEELYAILDSYGDDERLDKEDKKDLAEIVSKMAYLKLRLTHQSENTDFNISHAVSLFTASIYVLSSTAFFVVSLVDFIILMCGKDKKKLFGASTLLLALVPAMAITAFASIHMMGYPYMIFSSFQKSSASATFILSVILPSLLIAYYAIDRVICGKEKPRASAIVKRTLSTVAALLLLISTFLPAFSFEVKAAFGDKSRKETISVAYDASHISFMNIGDEYVEYVETMDSNQVTSINESLLASITSNTKKDFLKHETHSSNMGVVFLSLFGYGGTDLIPVFTAIPAVITAITIVACVLIWLNMYSIATGSSPRAAITIPVRVLGIILATLAVAGIIAMTVICNFNLDLTAAEGARASVGLGAGVIISLVASIAAMSIPMAIKKRSKQ